MSSTDESSSDASPRDHRGSGGGWMHRIDVRLGLSLAGIYAPLVALVLFTLYAFAAVELLELVEVEMHERLSQLEIALSEPSSEARSIQLELLHEQLARDGGGYVVRDAEEQIVIGDAREANGSPVRIDGSTWWRAIRMTPEDLLQASRRTGAGDVLEIQIGSEAFVRERDEIQRGFWATLVIGVVLVAGVSLPVTQMALAPLRRATRTTAAMDPTMLDARLPTRGTRDDVDRHSIVLNALLDRIAAGFARIQAFSQDVAHELRTPVNRILNATEIGLLETPQGSTEHAELQSIHDSAQQMATLVENLLLLARGEEGRLAVAREDIDVVQLCASLFDLYEPVCDEAGIDLEMSVEPGTLRGDPALLMRTLANLVDNAMAHTPAGGTIRLTAESDLEAPGSWAIEVVDTGPGVPEAESERIFDRFVRLDPAGSGDGTGLGLAIARALARAHGGDVTLRPTNGFGARFVVRLPVVNA